jgi:hypothetical protein
MNFLSINFLHKVDHNDFEFLEPECKELLKQFFSDDDGDKGLADEERIEIFNQVCSEA